jgi:vacuolar-type H+-ATPase subunit C/Vma6
MTSRFYYESGQGDISDENGEEAMDLEESIDLYNIRTLMKLSRYKLSQKPILKRVLT